MGARSAGNPHAACDVEGTGNVARSSGLPTRQSSTLPMSGMFGKGAMVEPLRHRQTKGAATDMFYLMAPRHISTLPKPEVSALPSYVCVTPQSRYQLPR